MVDKVEVNGQLADIQDTEARGQITQVQAQITQAQAQITQVQAQVQPFGSIKIDAKDGSTSYRIWACMPIPKSFDDGYTSQESKIDTTFVVLAKANYLDIPCTYLLSGKCYPGTISFTKKSTLTGILGLTIQSGSYIQFDNKNVSYTVRRFS